MRWRNPSGNGISAVLRGVEGSGCNWIDQKFGDTIVSTIDWHSVAQAKFIQDIAGSEDLYRKVLIPRLEPIWGAMAMPNSS